MVVATSEQLLAEGDDFRWVVQSPVLMGPELSCGSSSSLDFIHVESNIMLSRKHKIIWCGDVTNV